MMDRPSTANNATAQSLIARFKGRTATVGVIGLGYVGLPLVCRFAEAGFRTIGFDFNPEKVRTVGEGNTYLSTVPAARVAEAVKRGLTATTDYALASKADALIICVPTPLTPAREPDLQFIVGTLE